MATSKSNLDYAHDFLGVTTLQTRHSDSLDFYEVHIDSARSMLSAVAAEQGKELSEEKMVEILRTNLLMENVKSQNSDYLDFQQVSIWGVHAAILAARAV